MKSGIHPNYTVSIVTCACGSVFETRSTKPVLRTDLCNVCHPFFTGEQRIVDTAGQVERFMRRVEGAASDGRTSKRQQRLSARSVKEAEEQARQEELAAQAAAEEAAARSAARAELARAAEAQKAANAAATVAVAAEDTAEEVEPVLETVAELVEESVETVA